MIEHDIRYDTLLMCVSTMPISNVGLLGKNKQELIIKICNANNFIKHHNKTFYVY